MLEEQAMPGKVKEPWLGSGNTDVEPAENIGYFELLAHDREKGTFDSTKINFQTFKWKLERFSTYNLLRVHIIQEQTGLRYF